LSFLPLSHIMERYVLLVLLIFININQDDRTSVSSFRWCDWIL
jgi:long-subunit acyl-CoA synthetase (AMP-forming)